MCKWGWEKNNYQEACRYFLVIILPLEQVGNFFDDFIFRVRYPHDDKQLW